MTFDDVTGDGRLWAVRFEEQEDNELYLLFDRWSDVEWLRNFFKENREDLHNFNITDMNTAIADVLEDAEILEGIIMDISPNADLDTLFKPLNNSRTMLNFLEKMKARGNKIGRHSSWLRIYAIRLTEGIYIVTGGAIKLTATMQERPHTALELQKIDRVRRFLVSEGIIDNEGFIDYISELK
ncbi:MAG: hypothetical protein K2I90_09830 [Odoribacter sp.]|nr:hypothetical protein [Odoribacter sp.]